MNLQTSIDQSAKHIGNSKAYYLLPAFFCLLLLAVIYFCQPFTDELATSGSSLTQLSWPQKSNIELAAKALDGTVVLPGEKFSFNKVIGPRTVNRGYKTAPSYLNQDSPGTEGGGICLVSSLLYQSALKSGLKITERLPHTRPIKTVTPGLDATVWYGRADLCFENTLPNPVQVKATWSPDNLIVKIIGKQEGDAIVLRTQALQTSKDQLQVDVFSQQGPKQVLVSRDIYRLAP